MTRFVAASLTIMAASGCGGPEPPEAALRRQYPNIDWRTISAVSSDTTVVVPLSDSELEEAMRQIHDELEKANPNERPLKRTSGSIGRDSAWEIVEHSAAVATRYTFARRDGRWRIVDSARVK